MQNSEMSWLDYFSGGVPTGEYFRMTLDYLRAVSTRDDGKWPGINRLQELCFVGLASYCEAFFKDHFASLINLEPSLVSRHKAAGQNVDIDSTRVALYGDGISHRMGFILAEKYDFGTAQRINSLFSALLMVTPFGADDAKRYSELLRDRNLLVHHGGTFTLSYLEQNPGISCDLQQRAFFDSRAIAREDVTVAIDFVEGIARKLVRASYTALAQYAKERNVEYSGERRKAFDGMLWSGDSPA
jgi:hypothetical protein